MNIENIEKLHHALTGHYLQLVSVGSIQFIPKDASAILVVTKNTQLQIELKSIAKKLNLVACINPIDLDIDNYVQLNRFLSIIADNTEALKMDFISGVPEKLISSRLEIDWIERFIEERLFIKEILKQ